MTTKQSIQWWQVGIVLFIVAFIVATCGDRNADAQGYAPPTTTQVGATGATGAAGANGVGDSGMVGVKVWAPADNPSDGATLTIGDAVYEFDGNASADPEHIAITIGENVGATIDALVAAIDGGTQNLNAVNVGDNLFVFTSATPGGANAAAAAPTTASSEVADIWVTIQAGRAANRRQASGRVVLDEATAADATNQWTTFDAAFVSCAFFTASGAPKTTTATCEVDTSTTPDTLSIDPTAGDTPLVATDIVVFTVWE